MNENKLKIAQKDIEEVLIAVEDMEKNLNNENLSKNNIKEQFVFLSNKVQELENILKEEGIID